MLTGYWRGNLRERGHLEGPGVDGRIILKMYLREVDWFDLVEGQVAG